MDKIKRTVTILLAEDDEDDYILIKKGFKSARLTNELYWVKDGEELMDYLYHRNQYAKADTSPRPCLILLDLNMPRKDGREALKEIKADPDLQTIPVVILTTSKAEEDILSSYRIGVNSFVRKPVKFGDFVKAVNMIGQYWFELVELPDKA